MVAALTAGGTFSFAPDQDEEESILPGERGIDDLDRRSRRRDRPPPAEPPDSAADADDTD